MKHLISKIKHKIKIKYLIPLKHLVFNHFLTAKQKQYITQRINNFCSKGAINIALTYRNPEDLSISPTPIGRSLLIGSCVAEGWVSYRKNITPCDFILFNYVSELPTEPPYPIEDYDLTIVQIPLRSILPEVDYFRLPYGKEDDYQNLFDHCVQRLELFLSSAMKWNKKYGALTFVSNFMVPQQNPLGRLLPRYDLRNYVYFIEQLNVALSDIISTYQNTYLLDVDQISVTHGRMYIQNDLDIQINHGGINCDWGYELDLNRMDALKPLSTYREIHAHHFPALVWNEVLAMLKILRQTDTVKAVIIDLDDTIWRGVMGDEDDVGDKNKIEGWPLAFVEALLHLKRRGIMLAIVSKNDAAFIEKIWDQVFYGRIILDDFVARKINWQSKPENIAEILKELNILPEAIVFIDDNPRERGAVNAAFPKIRILGSNPYLLRQILLWSPETQVPFITEESGLRTQMVQTKIKLDSVKSSLTPEDFLEKLNLRVKFSKIKDSDDSNLKRVLELLNKTNQFNTTGKRWTFGELTEGVKSELRVCYFDAQDIYSSYGIIGVIICKDNTIMQMVMSCRVVGLGVEFAAISETLKLLKEEGFNSAQATTVETASNLLSRHVFEKSGFTKTNPDLWTCDLHHPLLPPSHISLS